MGLTVQSSLCISTFYCTYIGGGSGTASTATAVPKFDKWGLSRTKLGSEQFQYLSTSTYIAKLFTSFFSLVSS